MIDKLSTIKSLSNGIKDVIGLPSSTSLQGIIDSLTGSKEDLVDNLTNLGIEASMSDTLADLANKVGAIILSPTVENGELIFASGSSAEVEGSELQL